ncbi:MAG: hypothetical protein J6A89_06465 [Clostridia bacterium]|nr:hypothetical protein [Clostridia bacterium]
MNKKAKILIIVAILIVLLIIVVTVINKTNIVGKTATKLQQADGITVVPTMRDTITADSSWCGTFQLVWNDMKNDVVKKDVIFTPQEEMAENLNKEEFTQDMLSEEYYFKTYGLKSLELKEQIENGIKEKFNQESDILNDFNWSESELYDPNNADVRRYFFYVMLYRKFEFLQEFDKLENGKFGDKYNDIEYFGIDESTKNSVGNQIDVLYYNSKDDFAIIVNTKTDDEVIFCKSPQGKTFNEIYENMNKEQKKYTGSKNFKNVDEFKAPNLKFNEKREYTELQNKEFKTADPIYDTAKIEKAIQTIKFSLDEKGGEIKSEAAIDMKIITTSIGTQPKTDEPRYFYVDDTFTIFLREKGQELPYFAGRIEDITKFQ